MSWALLPCHWPHLNILLDVLLSEALSQHCQPPLQLETQGHLPRATLVPFSDGLEHGILQEKWVVLGHPGARPDTWSALAKGDGPSRMAPSSHTRVLWITHQKSM